MQKMENQLSYSINVEELFRRHFPMVGFATKSVANAVNPIDSIQVLEENQLERRSQLGTPIWDYIQLNPSVIEGTGKTFEGYTFPDITIIEPDRAKKVVETDVVGRDGSIDELMGLEDWDLKITGLIINYDTKAYPEKQVKALQRVCELKSSFLECEGTMLTMLGIRYLSLRKLRLLPSPGYDNVQKFEIEAKSKNLFVLNP